jgi:hypothetical protein
MELLHSNPSTHKAVNLVAHHPIVDRMYSASFIAYTSSVIQPVVLTIILVN